MENFDHVVTGKTSDFAYYRNYSSFEILKLK